MNKVCFFWCLVSLLISSLPADTVVSQNTVPFTNKPHEEIRHYLFYRDMYVDKEYNICTSSVHSIDVYPQAGLLDSTRPYAFFTVTGDGHTLELIEEPNEQRAGVDYYYNPAVRQKTKSPVPDRGGIVLGGIFCGLGAVLTTVGISVYSINRSSRNPACFLITFSPGIMLSTTGIVKLIKGRKKQTAYNKWERRYQ